MADIQITKADEEEGIRKAFMNFVEQIYTTTGGLPTAEKCSQHGFSEKFHALLSKDNPTTKELIARGVSKDLFGDFSSITGVLSELQLTAANVMLDLRDNRSQRKKLTELGISTGQWDKWLKDATFQGYLRQRAENLLGDNQHEAHYALLSRVRAGDINAIKYYNELSGRYVPQRSSGVSSNFDVKMLLTRIIEAIQKHVKDPEIQQAIAQEIIGYAQVQGFVNQVTNNVVPIPIPVGAGVDQPNRYIEQQESSKVIAGM